MYVIDSYLITVFKSLLSSMFGEVKHLVALHNDPMSWQGCTKDVLEGPIYWWMLSSGTSGWTTAHKNSVVSLWKTTLPAYCLWGQCPRKWQMVAPRQLGPKASFKGKCLPWLLLGLMWWAPFALELPSTMTSDAFLWGNNSQSATVCVTAQMLLLWQLTVKSITIYLPTVSDSRTRWTVKPSLLDLSPSSLIFSFSLFFFCVSLSLSDSGSSDCLPQHTVDGCVRHVYVLWVVLDVCVFYELCTTRHCPVCCV